MKNWQKKVAGDRVDIAEIEHDLIDTVIKSEITSSEDALNGTSLTKVGRSGELASQLITLLVLEGHPQVNVDSKIASVKSALVQAVCDEHGAVGIASAESDFDAQQAKMNSMRSDITQSVEAMMEAMREQIKGHGVASSTQSPPPRP